MKRVDDFYYIEPLNSEHWTLVVLGSSNLRKMISLINKYKKDTEIIDNNVICPSLSDLFPD